MLGDVMEHFGIRREFRNAGFFETQHHRHLLQEIKVSIRSGRLIAVTGIVGCGKTTALRKVRDTLAEGKEILVSKSLSVDKARVNLGTLILALFYDLANEKDFRIPTQPEKRERKLQDLIRKRKRPVALFIDEAHDLHPKTLVGLKRLIEVVQDGGGTLSVVLAGHPKLKNDLRRASLEEIGNRASVFNLEGIAASKREFIQLLEKSCTKKGTNLESMLTDEALDLLSDRLATPLQIEHYLALAIEEGFQIGVKPITGEIIQSVLAKDLDDLEPKLTRYGYNIKALADELNVRPNIIRSFLRGKLPPGRTQEIQAEMPATGIPV